MIVKMQAASIRDITVDTGIQKSNLARWKKQSNEILHFEGTMKRFHLHGAARPVMIANADGLEAFMHKRRNVELALTCTHVVNYLKRNHKSWLEEYLSNRLSGYKSLLKLLQQLCARHGFTCQKPAKSMQTQEQLEKVRQEFAQDFNVAFSGFDPSLIINVDETGMTYDMPPHAIWSVRGGSSKISSGEKHSYRMTVVLSVRANGDKLPILFIVRGEPGGRIESDEFDTYPIGHYCAVQESAWMDARIWAFYLRHLLRPRLEEPSVLLLDNFDSHVSDEGMKIASEECGCIVAPIPPNASSVVQPLDVGIMAPFKWHLRNLWLEEDFIEGSDSEEDVDFISVSAQEKRLVMIHRAIKAWAMITPEEVRWSFSEAIPQ
ncbi:hypothetical protein DYB32_010151 [Aphanomyces invadans]|uniref:DDE-1 domain-containing protein n=1 Tax=Aphanomyces invadans TaxID=157072 RepID=A0A418AGM0_9STRA|nr:hypothetical protein DYB32_010151 [Aphanomyces invadans]